MKKNWTCKLWWRVPCAILMLAGLAAIVVAICLAFNDPQEEKLSPNVITRQKINKIKLINSQTGKTILKNIDWCWNVADADSMLCYEKDNKYGYVNLNSGKVVVPEQYDYAWRFSNGLAAVSVNHQVGFIHPDGSLTIPMTFVYYDDMENPFFSDGYCVVADSTLHYGLINTSGQWVIPPSYDKMRMGKGYVIAGNIGEFNKQIAFDGRIINNYIIDNIIDILYDKNYYNENLNYEERYSITNQDFFEYKVNGCSGLMDKNGKFLTPPLYSSINGLNHNHFRAVLHDKYSEVILDDKGQVCSSQ